MLTSNSIPRLYLLCALLLVSIAINILQARHIWEVQTRAESATGLATGTLVKDFEATDTQGRKVHLFLSGQQKTVLYIFRPDCVWCQRNSHSLESLVTNLPPGYRLVGLSLNPNGLSEFVRSHRLSIPVYAELPASLITDLRLGATPETVIVSETGRVVESWTGAFTGRTKEALESFFSISISDALLKGPNVY